MEEPVVKLSESSTNLNSQLHQRMTSSEKRDRCIIRMDRADSSSMAKSRSETPSMLFIQTPLKPSFFASNTRSVS